MKNLSSKSNTPSVAFVTQWNSANASKKHTTPNYHFVDSEKREFSDLSYSIEKAVKKSTPSTAIKVVSVSVTAQDEHAAYELSDPEDWSDADDDDNHVDRQSWFYRPAPIMIPVYKPLYVPSVSFEEHLEIIRKGHTQRYTPYHKTCYYKKKTDN